MKKRAVYSHSRLSSFEQCPLKFKFRYIDKIIPEIEKSIEAHLGTAVHDTLEWIYNQAGQGTIPSLDNAIVYYSETWEKDFKDNLLINDKILTAKDYFNKGVGFIVDYYTTNQPFNDGTIELEKKIFIKLTQDGEEYNLMGFIDRFAKNTETGEYEIHDYKTGKSLPTQNKMDKDRQLALYSIAIKELIETDKDICLIWHYLAHNKKIISKRTNDQLDQLKQEIIELIKKIESTTNFPSKKSILCNWCEYKKMCPEHSCIEYKEILDEERYPTISKYIKG